MKTKLLFKSIIILTIILANLACNEDSVDEKDGDEFNYGEMQVKLYSDVTILRPLTQVIESTSDDTIGIGGLNCDEHVQIQLRFPDSIGTYSFEDEVIIGNLKAEGTFFPCEPLFGDTFTSNDYSAISGSVTLSYSDEEKVVGTFNFIGKSYEGVIRTVANGEFNILK